MSIDLNTEKIPMEAIQALKIIDGAAGKENLILQGF